ncbi:UDP-N-acetylglucosamine 2-epimerase [Granulicella arctica]|uniref:UDP-N-acetylglucosamine 2-epimerase n=1 Tax=Granulicella arctica TaxID=940613 RepID=UPI0021E05A7F|nr:UDP-N-acetylglucosamine 2-epimerase [Granulicella arctica]
MKTTIAVVTTSRADYSHLYWPLRELDLHPDVDLKLIVLASHLSPEHGYTVREIEKDGFTIAARLECLLSSDSDVGMAKTIGLAVLSLTDTLAAMRPDLLLLIADRYEMLAPATVALALRIPIAHIEGGELSQGAIDDAVRNALTKMSHVHFTSTKTARERVMSMGEEPWRVHHAGAPSLDHLQRSKLASRADLQARFHIDLTLPTIMIAYHPVTLLTDTNSEISGLFEALRELQHQLIFCYPNADAGSYHLTDRIRQFMAERSNTFLFTNLPAVDYWSLLREATLFVGNSSSGIMETASFGLPTVNIGMRQQGRERSQNVLDAPPVTSAILDAIRRAESSGFRDSLKEMTNIYGDGHASERIIKVLTSLPSRDKLLFKLVPQGAS